MRSEVVVAGRAVAVVALLAGLASCTSSSPTKPTGTVSPTALATDTAHLGAYCASLAAAAQKINAAEVALYRGATGSVAPLVAELRSLQAGAPAQIQSALSDMINGFVAAQDVLAHPTKQNEAKLAAEAPRLAADAQQLSTYLVSRCPAR